MLRFATPAPDGLLDAIDAAATFHDLGKLDAGNQAALAGGRDARLLYDHIDAGVAHLSAAQNWMAAWLVRAHHAPGLPSCPEHFDRDGLGRRLRGLRWDERSGTDHDRQIRRTDAELGAYLAAHEEAVDAVASRPVKAFHGLTMRLALSCLIDADHADTAHFDTGFELPDAPQPRWEERLQRLDEYVSTLRSSGSEERDRHRRQFYRGCREADITDPMIACEGPVGIGKTTAVTAYLLRRAQKDGLRCGQKEGLRRLIYVAPYTNIIAQTAERLRAALVLPEEDPDKVVVEHHHRADFESQEVRDLAVLWRAPVVVTTAVQFFESLASNHPGRLRKLHALPGSVVFIDEAHAALPAHLWPQNWRWLRELAEHWSCCFVFASGSLARFWEKPDVIDKPTRLPDLLRRKLKKPVLAAERRRIQYRSAGLFENIQGLIEQVCNAPGPRLVILNTVQSAAVVARAMRDAGHDTLHLSTALAPRDRAPILRQVEHRLEQSANWTLVATSCVEAGVDLSFRTAFRERFSTASLIQVGGRVNRHSEKEDGIVFDFVIDEADGITPHPAARRPAAVLKRQLKAGLLQSADSDPATLITRAMAEEIKDGGGLGHDLLMEAERFRDYPSVAERGRVIEADTRVVVVDPTLVERLNARERVGYIELLAGSVQLWSTRVNALRLETVRSRPELCTWPYEYDTEFSVKSFYASPGFNMDEYMQPPSGYKTFNQLFARHVKPGMRPVAALNDPHVITCVADSTFIGWWQINEQSKITVKGLEWSVLELLEGSPYRDRFKGGVFMHGFLNVFDYHRLHVPVGGVVRESRVIKGQVYVDVKAVPVGDDDGRHHLKAIRAFAAQDGTGYQFARPGG